MSNTALTVSDCTYTVAVSSTWMSPAWSGGLTVIGGVTVVAVASGTAAAAAAAAAVARALAVVASMVTSLPMLLNLRRGEAAAEAASRQAAKPTSAIAV